MTAISLRAVSVTLGGKRVVDTIDAEIDDAVARLTQRSSEREAAVGVDAAPPLRLSPRAPSASTAGPVRTRPRWRTATSSNCRTRSSVSVSLPARRSFKIRTCGRFRCAVSASTTSIYVYISTSYRNEFVGILLTRIWRHRHGEQAERQDLTFWNGVGLGNESVTRDGIKCLREAMDHAQTPKSDA